MKRAWPQIRAALVLAHVVAVVLGAAPAPEGGMDRRAWRDPTVQQEFDAWSERLAELGLPIEPDDLESHIWAFALGWSRGRAVVLAPFQPYYRYLGTRQSWRMFIAPHRFPTRLGIDVRTDGTWEPVTVERSAEHRWLGRLLDHDRMRSVVFRLGWPQYKKSWTQFAAWVAPRAAREFPRADRVRVRMWKGRTLAPEEVRAGRAPVRIVVQEVELDLAEYR